jgi:hypothetical protein
MRGNVAPQALGRAAQRHHDPAPDVEAGIIVNPEYRVRDAEANKHESGVELCAGIDQAWPDRHVGALGQNRRASPRRRIGDCRRVLQGCPAKGHLLVPAAIISARLQPERLEVADDIGRRNLVAARACVPSFQQVARKELDMGPDALGCGR